MTKISKHIKSLVSPSAHLNCWSEIFIQQSHWSDHKTSFSEKKIPVCSILAHYHTLFYKYKKKFVFIFHHVFDSFSQLFPFLCPRANRSHRSSLRRSLQKSDGSDLLFSKKESLFRSFAHKKRAIRSKNQRANSQPCRAFRGRKGSNDTENVWFLLTYFRLRSSGCNVNWLFLKTSNWLRN